MELFSSNNRTTNFLNKDKFVIKSPLNYTGGKYKLLSQILPLFPKNINTFVDLFGGGANVAVNVNANKIVYTDTLIQVVEFMEYCKSTDLDLILLEIDNIISAYQLSKSNKKGYEDLRINYNHQSSKQPMMFYALVCHSFSNQIRFNKKGQFNLPFGKRCFSPTLRQHVIDFVREIKTKNISFGVADFRELKFSMLSDNDFVYCDPPYLISCATYNESGGWTEREEKDLLFMLDGMNDNNVKFALSNILDNKGKENRILKRWSKKYNIHKLDKSYGSCNYHRKKVGVSTEVLITNY